MSRRFVLSGDLAIKVHNFVVGPFQENTFLVVEPDSRQALFIDPGADPDKLIAGCDELQVKPVAILNTHAHVDHVGAVSGLVQRYEIPFYLHQNEEQILSHYESACIMFGLPTGTPPVVNHWFQKDDELVIGPFTITCIETPGHTPGGTCFRIGHHVFVGDTLFYGSVGRVDLPGGNWHQLEESLVKLFSNLEQEDIVHCGHGPDTNRDNELQQNPYIGPLQIRIRNASSLNK